MILVITLFALLSSYLIASGMSRTSAEVNNERDRHTLQALQEAKAALIAYAASQAWTTRVTDPLIVNDQPGALPCPAADDAGVSSGSCNTDASRVGRFPWKSVGVSELRDSSGQILWYAVSANFRKASGTTVINSDTQGTLTVTGNTSANNAVALIIAPGPEVPILSGQTWVAQDRSSSNIANYLESTNATGTVNFVTKAGQDTWKGTFDPTTNPVNGLNQEVVFNDRIMVVTQADLMAVVEPAVAARIERDIKPYLQTYLTEWSAFPFPAAFANPDPGTSGSGTTRAQSKYVGDTMYTISSGLLPITNDSTTTDLTPNYNDYSWTTGSGTVSLTGGLAGSISGVNCVAPPPVTSSSSWRCDFTINAYDALKTGGACGASARYCIVNPSFRVTGKIGSNALISFADLPTAGSVTVTNASGSSNRTMSATAISGTLAVTPSAVATVNFDGTHTYSKLSLSTFTGRAMRVTIPVVVTSPLISSSDTTAGWFIKNEWYRQTYYAVSPGYLPGGGASCSAGSTCLTVNNLSSSYTTTNDKRAILIFAGRALTGSHPSSNFAYYLEGVNNTTAQAPANRIYTNRYGSAATINDQAIVLSP